MGGGRATAAAVRAARGRDGPDRRVPGRRLRRPARGRAVRAVRAASGWAGSGAATPTTPGSRTSWPGATARPRWCSTCTPRSPARWPGSRTSWRGRWAYRRTFFASRDRDPARRRPQGAFYAVAMSERGVGSRLSQLTTRYERGRRAASTSRVPSRSSPGPGTPTPTWSRPGRPPTTRWCRSSWCRPTRRA